MNGKKRILMTVCTVLFMSIATFAQALSGKTVKTTGVIVDTKGEPIIGAVVIQKGKATHGTTTDLEGKFTLEVPENSSLEISCVGYEPKTQKVSKGGDFTIMLNEDTQALEEVVVVGYTTQKRRLLAGAVETTKFDEKLSEIPVSSPSAVLAGRMSGVNVSTPAGQPGSQASISVRTGTTWNSSPMLFVIDGAVRDQATFNNLSTSEIESVSVLKDAASAAIYGARSDAGVILVTTKKGKEGRPSINYTANFSADFATQEVKLLDLYENGKLVNKMYENYGLTAPQGTAWSEEELEWAKNLPGRGFKMLDDVWNTPYVINHALSVTGGSQKIKYFAAANYYTNNGFMASTDYNRLNLRLNLTADITDNLQLFASLGYTKSFSASSPTEGTDATYLKARVSFETFPSQSPGGKYIGTGWAYGNPAAAANGYSGYRHGDMMNPEANISLTYKLPWIKGLSFKTSYMGSWKNNHSKSYTMAGEYYYPVTSGANNHIVSVEDELLTRKYTSNEMAGIWSSSSWTNSEQLNFQLSFDRQFGQHHVNAAAVYEASRSKYTYISNGRQKFPLYQTDQYWATSSSHDDMSAGGGPDTKSGRASWVLVGGYDYANKYIFNFSMRYDGSMNFAPDERWGLFPAASAAWVITEENFMKEYKKIDYLKLRASVGLTGNDAIGGWQWQESYATGNSYMRGEGLQKYYGLRYGSLVNEHLTWEKSLSYNIGLDYKFLGHLQGALEYWHKHTYDILGTRQNSLPTTFSRSMPAENYGIVNAQGIDFSIGWHDRTGNVDWSATVTGSYGWNKVIKQDYASGLLDWQIPVGKSRNYLTAYSGYILRSQADVEEFIANNPNYNLGYTAGLPLQPGMFVYRDLSGPDGEPDGIINKYDVITLSGNTNPVNFGLTLNAAWKNFTIETVFTGKFHHIKNFFAICDYHGGQMYNAEWVTNSWTPENPDAELPLMAPRDQRSYTSSSVDYWYKNTSYIRLSNLNIGYTFRFARPLGGAISSIKLYATGTNLFYISNFHHWDPELNPGWSGVGYPIMRTLGGGISVNF